jgi:hypothetical protein
MAEVELDDAEKVEQFLSTKIKSEVEAYYKQLSANQPQTQPTQTEQERAQQELHNIIRPIVDPDIQRSKFDAADAKDYTHFYRSNPDANETEIEATFKTLVEAGRPTTRADIARYLDGKNFQEDPTKFMAKQVERQKAQVQRAQLAGDAGAGALDRARNDPQWTNFASLPIEDMEKALDGVTF